MLSHFTTLWLSWLRSRCLTNPCPSDIWWLTIARRNSHQPVLVRIYRNCAILEAWLPLRRGFLSWRVEYVSSEHYCQAEVFCSGCMQIVEPLQSLQALPIWLLWIPHPLLPWDDYDCHWSWHQHLYIEWHNKYYQRKQKEAPKLAVEGNRFWSGPSSPPLILLPFLTWWLSPILVPGLSWPTITTQIQDPISMHTDHNFCAARCFSEN